MESAPTVTVIIATYNKAATLRYAVESVLWQAYEDYELWVIGDGCTDSSAQVVASYHDPRIHWYNLPENSGYQSAPHNEGLRRSRGRYIAYLNHDDIWLPNHLASLVEQIESTGADFVYSILEWVLRYADCYADVPHYPHAPSPPEASATLHKREIVEELGYWKSPQQTYAVPRAEFFRRAQFSGKRFECVPLLTVLKFGGNAAAYSAIGDQPEIMQRIRRDPDFAHREAAALLARAVYRLEQPPSPRLFLRQLAWLARRELVKHKKDPARLVFWHRPGRHIRAWRKAHRLDQAGAESWPKKPS